MLLDYLHKIALKYNVVQVSDTESVYTVNVH